MKDVAARNLATRHYTEALILTVLVGCLTWVIFHLATPVLFLLFPAAMFATFRFGRAGAWSTAAVVAAIGVPATLQNIGPMTLIGPSIVQHITGLVFVLAVMLATSLPIAAVLAGRRRDRERLAISEGHYRALVDEVSDVIFQADADWRWTFLSQRWTALTGLDPNTSIGQSALATVHPDDHQLAIDKLKPLTTGHAGDITKTVRYRHSADKWRWAEVKTRAVRDNAGSVTGFNGTIVDVTERVRSEIRHREEAAQYRAVFDSAINGIIVFDQRGVVRAFNHAAETMFKYAAVDVVGQAFTMLLAQKDLATLARRFATLRRRGVRSITGERIEVLAKSAMGGTFPIEISVTSCLVGGERQYTGIMRDLTQQKVESARLQLATTLISENNTLLNLAESIAHIGHWRVVTMTQRVKWSDETFRIHGLSDEFQPNVAQGVDFYHPDDRASVEVFLTALFEQGTPQSFFARVVRPTGEVRHVHVKGFAERDDEGLIITIFGIMQDVTSQVSAEAALRESETQYRLLAENVSDIILRLDLNDRCTYASQSIFNITGYAAVEVVGQNVLDNVHPEDRPNIVNKSRALNAGESDLVIAEYRMLHKLGHWLWIEARSRLLRDDVGAPQYILSVVREVADRKVLEADLIQARDAAEAGEKAKANFLATMSHELRTPMTGVLGMIDLLQLDPSPAESTRYFQTLESSAKLMMQVVDDILDFSKIEAGKLSLETVDFDLKRLVNETIELFTATASKRGVSITVAIDAGAGDAVVRGDPTRVRQILSNLVGNAVKFTESGSVTVTAIALGHSSIWRFTVQDTGLGMTAEQIPNLFQAFSQADNTTTRRFGGTGLGLAICRRLALAMDGDIGANSVPGEGSTFWFTVPLSPGRADAVSQADPAAAYAPAARTLRILVAEDNPVNQLLVTSILGKMGHDILCVADGSLAVIAVQQQSFDVVLMDMQMPVMDGPAATRAIRSLEGPVSTIPIFALTADALIQRSDVYAAIGLTGFLAKPIDVAKLRAALNTVSNTPAFMSGSYNQQEIASNPRDAELPVFNQSMIVDLRQDLGADLVTELLNILVNDVTARCAALSLSVAAGTFAETGRIAHAIKGAAGNLCAVRLERAAAHLETAAANADPGLEDQASVLLDVAAITCREAVLI